MKDAANAFNDELAFGKVNTWENTIDAVGEGYGSIILKEGTLGSDAGHYVVATGYDSRNDAIIYYDPTADCTGSLSKSQYIGTLVVGMNCDDETGNISDDTGNY